MDEKSINIEILKMFNILDIFVFILLFIFFIIFDMQWDYLILYMIAMILIKSFFKIGISKNESNNTILFLIKAKEDTIMYQNFKKSAEKICNDNDCCIKIVFVNNVIYNILIYNLSKKVIKIFYGYEYIVKLEITKSTNKGKNIQIVYSKIEIVSKKTYKIEHQINKFIEIISEGKNQIYEENIEEEVKKYNEFMIPMLQFIVASIIPIIDENKIEISENMLLALLKKDNKELNIIKQFSKRLLSAINCFKVNKIMMEKVIYTEDELAEIEKYLSNMYKYSGSTFEYNNYMAIITFYKKGKKNTIIKYLENAKKLANNLEQKIIIELNFGFIYFYYREYTKGISKYKNNLFKLSDGTLECPEDIINQIRDFINNMRSDRKVIGCDMSKILIDSIDNETRALAEQELSGLASKAEYIKITLKVRVKYEGLVKKIIYQNK